ncbi:major facilitator superfamily protein [Actinidia rufa]|uniref:Major facilitator superfamily protein n=1 Tax=Actinidia rufa TaxID=165716 RepID=A0A7J0DY75_9ERIC|nr:major facilitator superfamily protein [Actinidia rufa]
MIAHSSLLSIDSSKVMLALTWMVAMLGNHLDRALAQGPQNLLHSDNSAYVACPSKARAASSVGFMRRSSVEALSDIGSLRARAITIAKILLYRKLDKVTVSELGQGASVSGNPEAHQGTEANEAFEKLASFGLLPNMILYLMNEYHMDMATGSNIIFFWSAATNFLPVIGAVIADSSVGRFRMIGFGSIISLVGMFILWLTAMIPQAKPPPCDQSISHCISPTTFQLILLWSSFFLMSVGAGGCRSSCLAFGADQIVNHDKLKKGRALETYFSWYYVSATVSVLVAMTCVVYIQENIGWEVGFGVPVVLMLLSVVPFYLASPLYIKLKPKSGLITGIVQVIVAAYRNRHFVLSSSQRTDALYHYIKGSMLVVPTEKLSLHNQRSPPRLDRRRTGFKPMEPLHGRPSRGAKSTNQGNPNVVDWDHADDGRQSDFSGPPGLVHGPTHITSTFEIPAGSFSVFLLISLTLWISLYDRLILPLSSKIMKKPVRLTTKQRMGIGLFFSSLSMVVAALVESIRRARATKGHSGDLLSPIAMSALWLVPQCCLSGLGDAFNVVGQNEFYFSEFPRSMSSIAANLFGVGMGAANLLSSFIMSTVNDLTRRGGRESWVSSDINKGHLDYYYWVLAGLSLVNILYFVVCSWAYGPCEGEEGKGCWVEEREG